MKLRGRRLERKRLVTRLDRVEARKFAKIKRFVVGFCGKVSDAEVLRYLVRNWEGE